MPNPSTAIIPSGTVSSTISQQAANDKAMLQACTAAWAALSDCTTTTTTPTTTTTTPTTTTTTTPTTTTPTTTTPTTTTTTPTTTTTTTTTTCPPEPDCGVGNTAWMIDPCDLQGCHWWLCCPDGEYPVDTGAMGPGVPHEGCFECGTTTTTTTTTACNDGLGLSHTFTYTAKAIGRGISNDTNPCFCAGATKTQCADWLHVCSVEATNTITTLSRTDTCGVFYGECAVTVCNEGVQSSTFTHIHGITFDPITSDYTVTLGQNTLYNGPAPHTLTPPGPCSAISGQIHGFQLS